MRIRLYNSVSQFGVSSRIVQIRPLLTTGLLLLVENLLKIGASKTFTPVDLSVLVR